MSVYDILSIVISMVALVISGIALYWGNRFSKATVLQQIKQSIDNAKTHVEAVSLAISPIISKEQPTNDEKRQKEDLQRIYDSAFEKVLNAYEDGCQKYYAHLVLKQEFRRSYFSDLRDYVEEFPDKFSEPITRYTYILKLYKEWHKP